MNTITQPDQGAQDHARINRVYYDPAQCARIEQERPQDGTPIPTDSAFELAAYRMPNGSRFVTLTDDGEETWQNYVDEQRNPARVSFTPYPLPA